MTITKNRYSLFPIQYPILWDYYKKLEKNHWVATEIKYSSDVQHWEKLNDNEKHFIKMILAFFAQSDSIVNENLAMRFANEVPYAEAKHFYYAQMYQEAIHAESYNLMINEIIKDDTEREKLFNAMDNFPSVAEKAKWAIKWIGSNRPLEERLFAFAIVEGVFFSGSFCSIYWFKTQRGLMHALGDANDFISRDEALHWSFAATLYHNMVSDELIKPIDPNVAKEMIMEAIDIESRFVKDILPVSMIGMNADDMIKYIKAQADNVISWFYIEKCFNETSPFDFMKMLDVPKKNNFFERLGSSYVKAEGHIEYENSEF